ncbi:acyl-CoA dehydrogenase [Mycetocola tolaasinivorans]|uniref:Acyl-CoA dehydrogenase n=1 Tax=Mycetocola tolaasinivorans TaxID=76635 RepID=A0A3L7A6F0_9MICO|nr:acyl-CoA dehydrogenase family protein [Mycetocola tolaasinivorans]RLP75714.1 acyl-CoA dehydrogenase [Mycetocola tolaasinivorans]
MGAAAAFAFTPPTIRALGGDPDPETTRWLEHLEPVFAVVEAARDETEANRASSEEVHRALVAAGLTRMWVAPALGGAGLSLTTGLHLLTALAAHDASISWQIGVQGAIGRFSDYLAEPVAREIFSTHDRLVIGSVNPTGRAVRTESGDYLLSGRWGLASGSPHAEWFVAAARVLDVGGVTERDATGNPEIVHLFVPRSAVTLLDTWYSLGLRGTASADFTISEVRVPRERAVAGEDLLRPPPRRESRGYPIAYHDFGPFTSSATALGIAEDAVTTFIQLAATKTPAGAATSLARSGVVQERLARAEALLLFARAGLERAAAEVEARGEPGGAGLSALVRITAAAVAESTKSAVGIVIELSGSSSVFAGSRLERALRDVHTATKHITLSASNLEMVGQYLLGGPLLVRK